VCGENIEGCGENLKKVAKTVNQVAKKIKFMRCKAMDQASYEEEQIEERVSSVL
jgi:archaellum component FlaC